MINTGLKKTKAPKCSITVIKEDHQAFGTFLNKDINLSEAFQYPITAVPLSIATTENQFRQSNKCKFHNR